MNDKRKQLEKLPIYIKAKELLTLCLKFTDLIFDEYKNSKNIEIEVMVDIAKQIRENALTIPAKIAGAAGVELYDIKMENATIIRKCAREISTNTYGLEIFNYTEEDYLELIRNEVEDFRILFAAWVKTFDQWSYIIDRWGLFNPPGIEYDDHDPDDDLPFNPNDFFDDDCDDD